MLKSGRGTRSDTDDLMVEFRLSRSSCPSFTLSGETVDLWSVPHNQYVGKSTTEYVRERILQCERDGQDAFPDIVGKKQEKELVKNALMSGSPVLFKGNKGYGKTTLSKSIARLLPDRVLAIKGCKIHDDPLNPTCFSCKRKILDEKAVELEWIPRVWVRIPGDPMLTTRQLIGGISIQKIREGYDLDHPEVFVPGRTLKANRGVGYFDELGAIPSSLQTMLHELFEERQVTTSEGDIIPFKIDTIEIAATNPANYRGTSPIKEPLLDRMEEIMIGPPETLLEEIEIGVKNMYTVKTLGQEARIPDWHLKTLARIVRLARENSHELAKKIESEPSCRATIKLFDHITSSAKRKDRQVPLLSDYGRRFEIVKLALMGRIEVAYGVEASKGEIIEGLTNSAIDETSKEVYGQIPNESFSELARGFGEIGRLVDGSTVVEVVPETVSRAKAIPQIDSLISKYVDGIDDETYLSAIEIVLESISRCAGLFERKQINSGICYILRERNEA